MRYYAIVDGQVVEKEETAWFATQEEAEAALKTFLTKVRDYHRAQADGAESKRLKIDQ